MRPSTPNLNFAHLADPSSPPATPIANSFRFSSNANATATASNTAKHLGVAVFTSAPPSNQQSHFQDGLRPIGQGPHFSYTRTGRFGNLSPRSSTTDSDESDDEDEDASLERSVSSRDELSEDEEDEDESDEDEEVSDDDSEDEIEQEDSSNEESDDNSDEEKLHPAIPTHTRLPRIVSQGNFTLTEVADDEDESQCSDAGLEVMRPDHYEDAESDHPRSGRHSSASYQSSQTDQTDMLAADLRNLDCADHEAIHDEWVRRQRATKRANRLSSGSLKRPFAEGWGSDKEDMDGDKDRRTKRKINRGSLLFDDPPIFEEREPPGSVDGDIRDPIMDPYTEQGQSVDRELPYYVEEAMEMD